MLKPTRSKQKRPTTVPTKTNIGSKLIQSTNHRRFRQSSPTHAQQPAGRKAFQTTPAKTLATNPNTSKTQFKTELLKAYNRDGYVVVKNMFPQQSLDTIHNDMVSICRGKFPNVGGLLSTTSVMTDAEVLSSYACIEHPLKAAKQARDILFQHPQFVLALKSLIGSQNIKCVSSEYWLSSFGDHGRAWDQDETTIMTRDKSLVMALIALDDLTVTNGTLLLMPGSHKSGILYPTARSAIDIDGNTSGLETSFDWQNFVKKQPQPSSSSIPPTTSIPPPSSSTSSPSSPSSPGPSLSSLSSLQQDTSDDYSAPIQSSSILDEVDAMTSVPVDLPRGSVLFVHGYCLHRMMPTLTDSFRFLLRAHFSSSNTFLSFNRTSNSHAHELFPDVRDFIQVCGVDPYSYKGMQNVFPTQVVVRSGPPNLLF